jgi:RNA-directed DNA polymerase
MGKRLRLDVMVFERNLEDNVHALRDDLLSGRYVHGSYEPFTVFDPKQRLIHKAAVRDRLVHQAVVNAIEPLFEPRFIFDSYSCRVGKGVHAAVRRLRRFFRRASRNDTRTVYALKCDIRKFFASVDHEILFHLLNRRVRDARTLHLLRMIVKSFPCASAKGIPLGNLTSQLFANVYLHELDHFVKHTLGVRYYVRYCDDVVMLATSADGARELARRADAFLHCHLRLELHPDKTKIQTWRQGVDFLGYVLLPHAIVLRAKTAQRMLARVTNENLSSYLGICLHADAYDLGKLVRNRAWGAQ